MSKLVKHLPCDACGSSDAVALYTDGHTYCFSCGDYKDGDEPIATATAGSKSIHSVPDNFTDLADRHISAATARKYGVTNIPDEGVKVKHIYPYYDRSGIHVANKLRFRSGKDFVAEGPINECGLFGQQLFPAGSANAITLVEGECDAMAAFELQGSRYPCVSVRNGASGAAKDVADNFEYLNSFEQIVVCFDKDEGKVKPDGSVHYPGQEAALAVAAMFAIGKVRVLTLADAKDANDYLVNGWGDKFRKEWWAAPKWTPTGLKLGKDMWDEISAPRKFDTVPYPWPGLNDLTYGIRKSELVVVTAETGVGKTSVLKEIEYYILQNKVDDGVGFLHLEEPNADTALGLMSIAADKPLHLPDVREGVDSDELRKYYDAAVNSERVVIWDHFGSNSIHEVLAKVRHMHNLGCEYIVLDHLSIVVSDQSGDERKQLDEITTKLKTLCMELNIAVIAVIHLNRAGLIRGTAGVEQLANIVVRLERNKVDPDAWRRNVTKLVVEKNRFCGRTGPGCWLYYDEVTGRLRELDGEQIKTFEAGETSGW